MTHSAAVMLSGPAQVLEAIPHLLGFHPERSLVILWLHEGRLMLVQRVDLPAPDAKDLSQWQGAVWLPVHRVRAQAAIVALYADTVAEGLRMHHIRSAVVASCPVSLIDFLTVGVDGWSQSQGPIHSWPAPGRGDAGDSGGCDVLVLARDGEAPLASRDLLSLAPVSAIQRPSSRAPGARVQKRTVQLLTHGQAGGVSDDEVAVITRGLRNTHCRDQVAGMLARGEARQWSRAWDAIVIRTPRPDGAPLATLSALAHWLGGDGARANQALDRALADDPHYRLAVLVDTVVSSAVPPDSVRRWLLASDPHDAHCS